MHLTVLLVLSVRLLLLNFRPSKIVMLAVHITLLYLVEWMVLMIIVLRIVLLLLRKMILMNCNFLLTLEYRLGLLTLARLN
jgi:hypothetical protein